MKASLLTLRLAAGWVVLLAVHTSAQSGQDAAAQGTNLPPWTLALSVGVKHEAGTGVVPANRAYITAGTNQFAFLMPDGFRLDSSDAQKVTLLRSDCSCVLTVRVISGLAPNGKAPEAEACHRALSVQYPGAKIAGELSLAADGRSGPAFDLQFTADGLPRVSRAGFIPSLGGVLEFSMESSPEGASQAHDQLYFVVLTFRGSDASGKLEVMPLSEKL